MGVKLTRFQCEVIQKLLTHAPKKAADEHECPLVPKIEIGERGDDNRVTVTVDTVPLSSTYDVP